MNFDSTDEQFMQLALDLAARGIGHVEPNPLVGCVLVRENRVIGQGWHEQFGLDHAEVNAIRSAETDLHGATAYVTLEPCSHHGKTPPCANALVDAGISRAVLAMSDPFDQVHGRGIELLTNAGIEITVGVLENSARELNAPYLKRIETGLPWVIAKWAMTWDGKMATRRGDSQWISNEASRAVVHQLRGRVDGILVGSGTVAADDPMLNARPAGPRVATRIVVDSRAHLSSDSKLARSAGEIPVLVAVGPKASDANIQRLGELGCDVWTGSYQDRRRRLMELLRNLAERNMTNVMVEGGNKLLGSLRQMGTIDEIHVFLGPKLFGGGASAISPVGPPGVDLVEQADLLELRSVQQLENDIYLVGRTRRST